MLDLGSQVEFPMLRQTLAQRVSPSGAIPRLCTTSIAQRLRTTGLTIRHMAMVLHTAYNEEDESSGWKVLRIHRTSGWIISRCSRFVHIPF